MSQLVATAHEKIPRDENGNILYDSGTLRIPKFNVTTTKKDLAVTLEKMGVGDLFSSEKADFSNMLRDNSPGQVYVSNVVQKTKIEVAEEGLHASSATAVVMATRAGHEAVINNPFAFLVRHEDTGATLLYGKVYNPLSSWKFWWLNEKYLLLKK